MDAEKELARAIGDPTAPAIARATALSLLPPYLGERSLPAVEASLRDADPLVRRTAATGLAAIEPAHGVSLGAPLLGDPLRSVRFEALASLLDAPRSAFTDAQRAMLERVVEEYRRAETSLPERVESHLNLGSLDARLGNLDAAEAEYRTAIRLQPLFTATYVDLADLYRQQGREDRVIETLQEAVRRDPDAAGAYHAMGLSLVRQKRLGDALPLLEKASTLRPDVPRYAYVHAVALHDAGETRRALEALERAHERQAASREILAALAGYSREAGDHEAAATWARKLGELSKRGGSPPS